MPLQVGRFKSEIPITDLNDKSQDTFTGPGIYFNHAQLTMTSNEIFIDLYVLVPIPDKPPVMLHVNRLAMPHSLAKGFTTALANVIADHEADSEAKLPNQRGKQEGDSIVIWE